MEKFHSSVMMSLTEKFMVHMTQPKFFTIKM